MRDWEKRKRTLSRMLGQSSLFFLGGTRGLKLNFVRKLQVVGIFWEIGEELGKESKLGVRSRDCSRIGKSSLFWRYTPFVRNIFMSCFDTNRFHQGVRTKAGSRIGAITRELISSPPIDEHFVSSESIKAKRRRQSRHHPGKEERKGEALPLCALCLLQRCCVPHSVAQ